MDGARSQIVPHGALSWTTLIHTQSGLFTILWITGDRRPPHDL
jgi:hypothetical protein